MGTAVLSRLRSIRRIIRSRIRRGNAHYLVVLPALEVPLTSLKHVDALHEGVQVDFAHLRAGVRIVDRSGPDRDVLHLGDGHHGPAHLGDVSWFVLLYGLGVVHGMPLLS